MCKVVTQKKPPSGFPPSHTNKDLSVLPVPNCNGQHRDSLIQMNHTNRAPGFVLI